MNKIHTLSTNKPSRLHKIGNELGLTVTSNYNPFAKQQHIYITSDEEIKKGDWWFDGTNVRSSYINVRSDFPSSFIMGIDKKIILTTDPDLIAYGVQAINDEFLEWFVKNPSCEFVEIERIIIIDIIPRTRKSLYDYKIIIPKEEPNISKDTGANDKVTLDIPFRDKHIRIENITVAAEKVAKLKYGATIYGLERVNAFKACAKWLAERMYSEEEVLEIIRQYALEEHLITSSKPDIWFEQYKNK